MLYLKTSTTSYEQRSISQGMPRSGNCEDNHCHSHSQFNQTTLSPRVRVKEYSWSLGSPKPFDKRYNIFKVIRNFFCADKIKSYTEINLSNVSEIKANGRELEYILDRFNSIPQCSAEIVPCQTWRDNHAQFIYDNLT